MRLGEPIAGSFAPASTDLVSRGLWCDRGDMSVRPVRSRRRLPIRLRLTIAFAAVLAAMLGAAGVVVYTVFQRDLDDTLDAELRPRTADVVALLANEPGIRAALVASDERLAQVYAPDGRLVSSTRPLTGGRLLTTSQVRRAAHRPLRVDRRSTPEGDVRVRGEAARTPAGDAVVSAVAESLAARDHALSRLRELLFLVGPFALLLASYTGYEVARAALRPVERMRARAERITEQDTSERLPVPASRDEIEALGDTFNELLARLDAALARERRLLSDASHELRTPLTLLRTGIQVTLRRERQAHELREALESAGREAERVSRLAEDLLVLARADQGRLPIRAEPLDVGELLEAAAERARGAAGAAGRTVRAEVEQDGVIALADPNRAGQALDNLVGNALAHGRGEVRLVGREADGRVELHVLDDGEGFPETLLGHAFERFSQGDEARSGKGSGLGLAIVAAIARAHDGEAGARNRPEGGADVWLVLPAA
jgi:two-component system OmpR family sensor kinase